MSSNGVSKQDLKKKTHKTLHYICSLSGRLVRDVPGDFWERLTQRGWCGSGRPAR